MIYLFFAVYIMILFIRYREERRLKLIFFLINLLFAVWSSYQGFLVSAVNKQDCWFWYRMIVPELVFFPPLVLHFFLEFTGKLFKPLPLYFYILMYVPSFFFLIQGFSGILTIQDFIPTSYGWELIHAVDSPWYLAYTIYYIGALATSLILNTIFYVKTDSIRQKKQAFIILISALSASLINILMNTVLPFFDIYELPQMVQLVTLIWILGILYAIVSYRFIGIHPAMTGEEIFNHIHGFVLLIDNEYKIISANQEFQKHAEQNGFAWKNNGITALLQWDNFLKKKFQNLADDSNNFFIQKIFYKTKEEAVITDSRVSRIQDKFGDGVGFLIISNQNIGIAQLQKRYKLTNREIEIMERCLSGLSNREIAGIISIKEKTIETHMSNIYNKMGVNNRIELINLSNEYKLTDS